MKLLQLLTEIRKRAAQRWDITGRNIRIVQWRSAKRWRAVAYGVSTEAAQIEFVASRGQGPKDALLGLLAMLRKDHT